MKKISLILSLLFSLSAFAGFSPSCESGKKGFFRDQDKCEKILMSFGIYSQMELMP